MPRGESRGGALHGFGVVEKTPRSGGDGSGKTEGKEGELFHFGSGLAVCQQA
jgi:hypothetical protein